MKAAAILSDEVRSTLADLSDGASIVLGSDSLLCSSLERVLPRCLSGEYPDWRDETLDGVLDAVGHRISDQTLMILGVAILMSDQRVTPFKCELRADSRVMELRVDFGQAGDGRWGIKRAKLRSKQHDQIRIDLSAGLIDWVFSAGCRFPS